MLKMLGLKLYIMGLQRFYIAVAITGNTYILPKIFSFCKSVILV